MKTVYITKGLPASGKTTWAKEMQSKDVNIVRVNKDDLRSMLHAGRWSRANEKQVIEFRDQIIKNALSIGRHVIVDDTNLSIKHINTISNIAKQFNARVVIKDFTSVSLEDCITRDIKRNKSVGEKVIRDMYNKFLKQKESLKPLNPYIFNSDLSMCVIFDLDGTLSCIGDRSPYDGKSCNVDLLNKSIAILVDWVRVNNDVKTIIFSGRNGESRNETEAWLDKHLVYRDELYMRDIGDKRKDSIIKKEMFDKYIKDKYNVLFVVDDRDQVVKMWRDIGLVCLQANYGDF